MKTFLFVMFVAFSFNAQAGTLFLECTPTAVDGQAPKASWFKKLNLQIGREDQVSGSYVGYQNEDDRETDLSDKNQWFFPSVTSNPADNGATVVRMDFKGAMGSDEDIFELFVNRDGSAVLSGKTMADCGDGEWKAIEEQDYTCKIK